MRCRALLLAMLILSPIACLNDRPAKSTSLIDRVRGMGGPTGPEAVFIEYAVIERPAGSASVNREAWANIDEQVLPTETRALLGENGLRVGVVGGLLPSEIEAMIANPKSATGHRQRRLYVNNPAQLAISNPVALAEFQILNDLKNAPTTAKYEQARFSVSMTPTFATDGRITLKCVPEVEHQDKKSWLPTGAAGPSWLGSKPAERFESLAFDVTLSPREFAVIGAHYERGNWLGNQLFTSQQGSDKVQRLLIIRAGRLSSDEASSDTPSSPTKKDGIVPLAKQASTSTVRGIRP